MAPARPGAHQEALMNWLEVNHTTLRYEWRPGAGPVLVLIHEMGGSLENWETVCQALPDFQILRYDTRCAGLSEKPVGELNIDEHLADLAALLDALDIQGPLAVAGIAVGAAIAIRFAARYPQRVSHLVAMAPACGVAEQARAGTLQMAQRIREEGLRDSVELLLEKTWPASLRNHPEVFEQFRLRWRSADPQSFAATLTMLVGLDLEADLARLPARTLFVAGRHDALRPPAEIDRLASFSPRIEALHVESGHFMSLQTPELVVELLHGYLLGERSGAQIHHDFLVADCTQPSASGARHAGS
jgi:3-oxoadipate enol-lactonase